MLTLVRGSCGHRIGVIGLARGRFNDIFIIRHQLHKQSFLRVIVGLFGIVRGVAKGHNVPRRGMRQFHFYNCSDISVINGGGSTDELHRVVARQDGYIDTLPARRNNVIIGESASLGHCDSESLGRFIFIVVLDNDVYLRDAILFGIGAVLNSEIHSLEFVIFEGDVHRIAANVKGNEIVTWKHARVAENGLAGRVSQDDSKLEAAIVVSGILCCPILLPGSLGHGDGISDKSNSVMIVGGDSDYVGFIAEDIAFGGICSGKSDRDFIVRLVGLVIFDSDVKGRRGSGGSDGDVT